MLLFLCREFCLLAAAATFFFPSPSLHLVSAGSARKWFLKALSNVPLEREVEALAPVPQ